MGRMLIVDDQKPVRRLLEEVFAKEGWEVSMAANGKEAVQIAGEIPPDIILLDMKMPVMNGLEAAELLLSSESERPIIMMTGFSEEEMAARAMEAGVKACIVKPFDIADLKSLVEQLAGKP